MNIRKFRVIYWLNGEKKVQEVEAFSKYHAKLTFSLKFTCDDIIRIEEVTE